MHSAIDIARNGSCPFCAYLRGDRPFTIVQRDELTATLVTREQRGVPHLLIIPTRHCASILDVTDAEGGALMLAVRDAARAMDLAYQRPGIAIWQNNGVPASQAVGHVHFHVAGTLNEGGTAWGEVAKLSLAETAAIAQRLAPFLSASHAG